MAVLVPAPGTTSAASSTSTTASITVGVPGGALAGDVLLIIAVAERAEIPVVRLNNATTGLTTVRAETTGVNLSTSICWKRLGTADLNGTISVTNSLARRQAVAATVVRGAQDPVFTNHAFDGASAATAKTPPSYTPSTSTSVVLTCWAIAHVIAPYTGYTFAPSSPWVERVDLSSTYTGNINPTVYLASNPLGAGTGSVAQTNITVTSTVTQWDSLTSTVVFAPSVAVGPVARATVIQPIAEIDATASTAVNGGALTFSIAPSTGISQPDPGIFLVPYTSSPQTFTVTVNETGGGSSPVTVTVPAAPSTGSITNTTGVETVRFQSGAWI